LLILMFSVAFVRLTHSKLPHTKGKPDRIG